MLTLDKEKALLFKLPGAYHRQLKAKLASQGEGFADWFRRIVREELGIADNQTEPESIDQRMPTED